MQNYHKRTDCRLCDSTNINLILNLGNSTLANEFVFKPINQETYPLNLYQCNDCLHYQLLDVINPNVLFKDYNYVSGTSETMRRHFRNYACKLIAELDIKSDDLIIDIGSNDGTLLEQFQKHNLNILGVEPAENLVKIHKKKNIPICGEFFNKKTANHIKNTCGPAKLITCNNCFAHVDNLTEIVVGVKNLLKEDGIFVIEFSYFPDVVSTGDFSQIYHEHIAFHTIRPLDIFFKKFDMHISKIEHYNIHGGSIRLYVSNRLRSGYNEKIEEFLLFNWSGKLSFHEDNLSSDIIKESFKKIELKSKLLKLKNDGKIIAGAFASAKSTTFLHYYDIGTDILDCIFDDAKEKQNLFSPGKHIPILSFDELYKINPDYILILSYNFIDSVIKNHRKYLDQGGVLIVPFGEYKEVR